MSGGVEQKDLGGFENNSTCPWDLLHSENLKKTFPVPNQKAVVIVKRHIPCPTKHIHARVGARIDEDVIGCNGAGVLQHFL